MESYADFSDDGRYRYRLGRRWDPGPLVRFVMLNPSTAGTGVDDPTIRRCSGLARSWGYAGIEVVNLYAYRATRPDDLATVPDPVGPDNDAWLARILGDQGSSRQSERDLQELIIAAWGIHAAADRVDAVLGLLGTRELHCLGRTRGGQPRHPLYVATATRPVLFRPLDVVNNLT